MCSLKLDFDMHKNFTNIIIRPLGKILNKGVILYNFLLKQKGKLFSIRPLKSKNRFNLFLLKWVTNAAGEL